MTLTANPVRVHRIHRRLVSLAIGLGIAMLLSGCGSSSETAEITDELLWVDSGDFRGYFEPCG